MKFAVLAMCAAILVGCGSAQGNGTLIAGGGGALIGGLIGNLVSGSGDKTKGTAIGAAIGAAVGGTAGNLIGKKMDKARAAAAQVSNANVEMVKDVNGLDAIKVSFDNGILFATGKAQLQSGAQNSLQQFASKVLNVYTDCDVAIYGFASSDGDETKNMTLSQNRASAVTSYLLGTCGVSSSQIKDIRGFGETPDYLIRNSDGTENMAASRRVEVLLYASEAMIKAANAGTLK